MTPTIPGPQKPTSETGLYIRRHRHSWERVGYYASPSGKVSPTFRCQFCGDVIADIGVSVEPPRPPMKPQRGALAA